VKPCLEIRPEVGADLPPAQPDENQTPGSHSSRACTFKTSEQSVVFSLRSWENTDDATGVRAGAEYAERTSRTAAGLGRRSAA
jgi:hypothetical protein